MSSHKLIGYILVCLVCLGGLARADWEPYSEPANGPTYGTSDGMSMVYWNSSPYIFSIDYKSGIYISTDEGESWELGDDTYGTEATYILANPYTPSHVYIARDATNDEGFWVSTDGGASFSEESDGLTNTSITSIYIDPNGSHYIYVTCAAESGDDEERIFKSTDEGDNWNPVFEDMEYRALNYGGSDVGELDMTCMLIKDGDADRIWVGTHGPDNTSDYKTTGVWGSTDAGDTWELEMGGIDSRYIENHFTGPILRIYGALKLVPDPDDESNPYCYTESYWLVEGVNWPPNQNLALLKRTSDTYPNFDWNWELQGDGSRTTAYMFKSFDIVQDESATNYSLLSLSDDWRQWVDEETIEIFDAGIYIFDADDNDPDWVNFNDGLFLPYATALTPDPTDYAMLYCGTKSQTGAYGGVYKSTDFGETWTEKTEGMHTGSSLDIEYFSGTIWAGGTQPDPTGYGNMLSIKETGEDWSNRFGIDAYSFRDFMTTGYGGYIAVAVGGGLYGEDSIYVSEDGGDSFDAGYGFADDPDGAVVYGFARKGLYFYATLDLGPRVVRRGFNPTETSWEEFDDGWPSGTGDTAMAIDASVSGGILYAGSKSLGLYMLEDDLTPEWESAGLNDVNFNIDEIAVVEIFSASTADSLFVAGQDQTPNYRLLKSLNGGTSWSYAENGLTYKNIKGMESHPDHRSVILATSMEGSSTPHVYVTINGGSDWTDFSDGLNPAVLDAIKDIQVGPTNPSTLGRKLYVGTDNGIYETVLIVFEDDITSNTTWSDDYPIFVIGDVTVESGVTLTIEAGAEIYFAPEFDANGSGSDQNSCELIIEGTLTAQGSSGDSIKFIPASDNPNSGDWVGIFLDTSATAVMSYCSVLYSDIGLEIRTGAEAAVSNCNISNNSSMSIYNYEGSLNLTDSYIAYNDDYGVYGVDAVDTVEHTIFYYNDSYGIKIDGTTASNDDSYLFGNIITHSTGEEGSQYGIFIVDNDYVTIDSCTVKYYDQGGIKLDDCDPTIVDCDLIGNALYGIYGVGSVESDISETVFDSTTVGFKTLSGSSPIFGIHPDTSNNAFYTISNYFIYFANMHSMSSATLKAENCWWNSSSPEKGKFYVDDSKLREIDYNPYLADDPAPKLSIPLPLEFTLNQNYPNPFNPDTRISFSLDRPGNTVVFISNILGQRVATPVNDFLEAGAHTTTWDGKNESGLPVASGVYFYTIQFGDNSASKKMILLR